MGILSIDLSNIDLDDTKYDKVLKLLFLSDFWLGILNLKKGKALNRRVK